MRNDQLLNAIKHHKEHSWICKRAQKVIQEKQKERRLFYYKHSIIQWKKWWFICISKTKTDFLTFLSLVLSWYFEEKQRSFTSGDFWVLPTKMAGHSFPVSLGLPRWRPCQIPEPTLKCQNPYPGGGTLSQFPVGSPPPPPWGLTLIGA